jgi:hypothetical protein
LRPTFTERTILLITENTIGSGMYVPLPNRPEDMIVIVFDFRELIMSSVRLYNEPGVHFYLFDTNAPPRKSFLGSVVTSGNGEVTNIPSINISTTIEEVELGWQ